MKEYALSRVCRKRPVDKIRDAGIETTFRKLFLQACRKGCAIAIKSLNVDIRLCLLNNVVDAKGLNIL